MAFPSQQEIEKHSIPFYSDGVGTLRFKWENVGYDKLTPASMKMAIEGKLVTIPFQYGTLTENFLLDNKAKLWRIFCLQKYVPEIHKHFNIGVHKENKHTTIDYSQLLELLELL